MAYEEGSGGGEDLMCHTVEGCPRGHPKFAEETWYPTGVDDTWTSIQWCNRRHEALAFLVVLVADTSARKHQNMPVFICETLKSFDVWCGGGEEEGWHTEKLSAAFKAVKPQQLSPNQLGCKQISSI